MTKEADRWSDFSLGGSSYFIIPRKLSLINGYNVKKIFRQHMGHLLIMVKQKVHLIDFCHFMTGCECRVGFWFWGVFLFFLFLISGYQYYTPRLFPELKSKVSFHRNHNLD